MPAKKATPRTRKKTEERSIENPGIPLGQALQNWLHGLLSKSGTRVDRETTLGIAAFWRGMNLVSSTIGRLPIKCYKKQGDGGRDVDEYHPGNWVINHASETVWRFQFVRTLTSHCLQFGNGYAEIQRDELARPIKLVILDPSQTRPQINHVIQDETTFAPSGTLLYLTRKNGIATTLLPENVLHIRGLGFDGLMGYSVLDILRDSLGMSLALQTYGSVYFKHMAAPGVIIQLPGFFKDKEEIEHFRKMWEEAHSGPDNAHKPTVLQGGATVGKWQLSNEEAQFLATKEFEVKSIANIIGIPPHKLGANISTSYSSLEAENRSFLSDLEPWLASWEEELNIKLLTEAQKIRESHYFEFTRQALERADTSTETNTIIAQLNNGLLTLNQANALRNLPSIGEEGDKHRVPSNLTTIEDLAEAAKEPAPVPAPVPATGQPDGSQDVANQPADGNQQEPAPQQPAQE